jgi:hypothetical protein
MNGLYGSFTKNAVTGVNPVKAAKAGAPNKSQKRSF